MISVNDNINFVMIDGAKGALQTGFYSNGGSNGVGGVTVEGNVANYKVKGNSKSLTHVVTFDLISTQGAFNISLDIMADNTATATITSTTSMRFTWKGTLVALYNTKVFEGQNIYNR